MQEFYRNLLEKYIAPYVINNENKEKVLLESMAEDLEKKMEPEISEAVDKAQEIIEEKAAEEAKKKVDEMKAEYDEEWVRVPIGPTLRYTFNNKFIFYLIFSICQSIGSSPFATKNSFALLKGFHS